MRAFLSAMAAAGLLLIFSGLTAPPRAARRRLFASLDLLAADAGWSRIGGLGLLMCSIAAGLAAAIVGLALTANVAAGAGAAALGGIAPVSRAQRTRRRRRRVMAESWPDALSNIIAGVRAGMALPECCQVLSESGPRDLRPGFGSFAAAYAATASFETALRRLRDELHDPIADRVGAVLLMTHQVGGSDLVRVLRATLDMIREDARIRAEIHARWSWTVAAAKVAAAAPFVVIALMSLRPEGLASYSSGVGVTTLAIGTIATLVGYRLMLRAARLPEDQRLDP